MSFLLKPPRQVHGLREGCEYTPPPVDGSLTVSEIYDFHYRNNPQHPVFVYPNASGGLDHLLYSQVVPAVHKAARYVARLSNANIEADSSTHPRPLVAIVATTDTITYFTTLLGVLRAEIPVFPISPRNSIAAVAHLITKTQPTCILVSAESSIQDLVKSALDQVKEPPAVFPMPHFEDIYVEDPVFSPLPPRRRDPSALRIMVHTSGTSSFPKPLVWNDRFMLQTAIVPCFGKHDLCEQVFGLHAVAMYHAIGLNFLSWVATTGLVISAFAPASPATLPASQSVYDAIVETHSAFAFGVPAFIEEWAQDPTKVAHFKTIEGVVYGGAPLQKAAGDYLANEGVGIYTLYGLTETGLVGAVFPENPGADWEYLTFNPHASMELVPIGDGTYELVIVAKGPTQELSAVNAKFQGHDAYATSDLLLPHPSKAGLWKTIGRKDDIIVLSTGEKTTPSPLESILCQHPEVGSAVMFGRGRFQNGILVMPKEPFAFDPQDEQKLADFRNRIWPTVENMNKVAPSHSRLFKEMVIVTHPSKPFTYTPKGGLRRAQILTEYEPEIDAAYKAVEAISSEEPPTDWSPDNALAFVKSTVKSILKGDIEEHEDIFLRGCDSLQATWIRNTLLHALRTTSKESVFKVSQNLVYEHPNIASLSAYMTAITRSDVINDDSQTRIQELEKLLARYTVAFPSHNPGQVIGKTRPSSARDVILVTGTTGALGAAVLADLVASDSVEKVYAVNRPSGTGSILQRQEDSLRNRGYDPKIARSPKVVLIEGHVAKLDSSVKEEIRRTVTHIIHIAWRVDFNLSLSSFENTIEGVRALIDLALSSPRSAPPRFVFTSSIGVFRNHNSTPPIPEVPIEDPRIPLGQGYSESKWVAEQILYEAAKSTPLKPVIVRVGQICGGTNGAWNVTDWVPSIVKSSTATSIGCLPAFKGVCSWVPLDLTARALAEMRNAETSTAHLVHPKPVRAEVLFEAIGEELSLPLQPYAIWLEKLEAVVAAADRQTPSSLPTGPDNINVKIPATKLIDFFRHGSKSEGTADAQHEIMGIPTLAITEARASSASLNQARSIGPEDARQWLTYWRDAGLLP